MNKIDKERKTLDEAIFKNSVRLLAAGYTHDGNDIEDIPRMLAEMAGDYDMEINKQ